MRRVKDEETKVRREKKRAHMIEGEKRRGRESGRARRGCVCACMCVRMH